MSSLSRDDFLLALGIGGVIGAGFTLALSKLLTKPVPIATPVKETGTLSTTNSGIVPSASGGGGNVYETATAVSEYLMFNFGDPKDVLPYAAGPHDALQFTQRCVRHATGRFPRIFA